MPIFTSPGQLPSAFFAMLVLSKSSRSCIASAARAAEGGAGGAASDLPDLFKTQAAPQAGDEPPVEGFLDFDEWLLEQAGVEYPDSPFDSPEYKAYEAACDAARDACPVEVIWHCSGEYPMYFLALRGTERKAFRGTPVAVGIPRQPTKKELKAMAEFCEKHGIEWQNPQWHIFSMWS